VHKTFDLAESLFYGVEVRRIRRQVDELASLLLDELLNLISFVSFKRLSITTT